MNTDPTPDLCCTHKAKLDRAVELLEALVEARVQKPRGYSLADQFNDLIKRHERSLISDAQFYNIIAEITGIRHPDEQVLQRFGRRELNAEEAREAEAAGLLVAECTAASDPEPVFLADRARRPEQGHIINGPRFQAALEEFRQTYEEVREGESRDGDSTNT